MDYWSMLILAFLDAIRECIANRDRETVERELNAGGARIAGPIRRALRRGGLRGHKLRHETQAVMDELEAMGPTDIEDLVDDALEDPDPADQPRPQAAQPLPMKGHGL